MGFEIFVGVLVVLAIFVMFSSIKVVPQGFEFTVERFGRYTKTIRPGLHLIVPFIDRVGRRMNMMEQVLDIPAQEVITRDNAQVSTDAVAFIQVMDAAAAAYEVANLTRAITNLSMTNIRTVIGSLDLDEVLSNRDDINERLLKVIDAATQPWGVKVTRVEIKDLEPPADITEAMARQMKAERLKRAEVLTAEGEKQSAILRAEGEKQSAVLEAEGRREAAFRDAEAREREAEAEAKATQMVSQAIAEGDVQAINYFVAQDYVKAFEKLAISPQQKTLILPADMASLAGTIAGIGTLAKEAFDDKAPPRPNGSVPPTQ
ncbi:MAG: SPFH domain-containing protein [Pseudomonadota bacterium]